MADTFGAETLPAQPELPDNQTPDMDERAVGDPALTYFTDFLRKVIQAYASTAWDSVSSPIPIVVKSFAGTKPGDHFIASDLPAIYVYRPGKETRETVETFEYIAEDWYVQKGRIAMEWVLPMMPQETESVRSAIMDVVRKAIAHCTDYGRDISWIVENDPDEKAAAWGSSLTNWTKFMSINVQHAAPGTYVHQMTPPARDKHFDELKVDFIVEEKFEPDLTLIPTSAVTNKLYASFTTPEDAPLPEIDMGDAEFT